MTASSLPRAPHSTSTEDREAQLARIIADLEEALTWYGTTRSRQAVERALREARR